MSVELACSLLMDGVADTGPQPCNRNKGKNMKKFLCCLIGIVFLCSMGIAQAATRIKFAHGEADDQTYGVYATMFARKLEELSKGEMKCTIFSNATMGAELELGQKVQQGTLNMALVTSSNAGSLAPSANVLSLPYIFDSSERLMGDKGLLRAGSPFFNDLQGRILKESGRLRLIGVGTNGFRLLFTAPRPVTSLADLKGLKLRLPPSPVLQRTWEAWGAAAYPIAWSETFTAIQQGVADAYESPLDTLLKSGFYPYTKHVTEDLTYSAQTFLLLVNERWFSRLKPEQQDMIRKAAAINDVEHFAWVRQQSGKIRQELESRGVTFHTLTDAPEWERKAVALWPEFAEICGGQEWVDTVLRYREEGAK